MHALFGRVVGQLWAWLLALFRYVVSLFGKPGRWLVSCGRRAWLFAGRVGLAGRHLLTRFIWKPFLWLTKPFRVTALWLWRFSGRVGLAVRNLLFWLVWEPFLYVITPFRRTGLWLWRFVGRLGLALRRLLTRFVWRPFFWLYGKTAGPILAWLINKIRDAVRRRWQAGTPKRRLRRRHWRSRWLVLRARLRVALKRPKPPVTAVDAPRQPHIPFTNARSVRLATAFISITIVLIVSFATLQDRQPGQVAADFRFPRIIIATPSPVPTTPTPIPPEPTVAVKLTPWATPDPLRGGGSIAFTLHQNGNSDIYVLPVGQTEPIRLTAHPAPDREPAWSPDGQEIAFSSRRDGNWEIYVYNIPQGKLRRITDDLAFDGHPNWSPDSQWLVYESYQADNLDIYIMKADLSEGPYRLTENTAPDFAPVWSPGGRQVAFTSWRDGNQDIFLMSLDEISDRTAVNVTNSPTVHEDEAAFSPDGRYLAYSEDIAGLDLIYAVPLSENETITGPPQNLGQQGHYLTWSPDSQSIVYVYERGDKSYLVAGSAEAWGGAPQTFVTDGRLSSPSWSGVNISPALARSLGSIDPIADEPLFVEAIAPPEGDGPPVLLWELPVNAPIASLSDQVDQSFLALRQRVVAEAGWDFLGRLDNLFEAIDSGPLPGQTGRTWNKAGRAFDLYYREALGFEPGVEVIREQEGDLLYWRVYLKTAVQDGSQGELLRQLPWDFQSRYGDEPQFYDQGGRLKEAIPAGYYVDFTALAADYGWMRVPAGENWRTFFPAIRFWHYQKRQGLTWEEAMRQLYTAEEMERVP